MNEWMDELQVGLLAYLVREVRNERINTQHVRVT